MLITLASASPNWWFPDWRALAVDAAENWTVVWGADGGGLWSRRRESGAGWQAARLLASEVGPFDLAVRRDGNGVGTWPEQQADGDYVVWALHFDAATGAVVQRQAGPEIAGPISDVSVAVAAGSRYLGQCRGRDAEVVAALNDVLIISKRPYNAMNGPAMVLGCIESRLVADTLVVAIDVGGRKT